MYFILQNYSDSGQNPIDDEAGTEKRGKFVLMLLFTYLSNGQKALCGVEKITASNCAYHDHWPEPI